MLINQNFSVDRTKYIGGSDIGAILGLSRYRTPLEVWMEKTGKEIKSPDSLPLRFGSYAEEFVAREYSLATGNALLHDQSIHIHPKHSFMSAHIDRFVLGNGASLPPTKILECKTANPFAQHDWGEAGSDQVPMSYLAQCVWYMAITGIEKTDLAVLFGNCDFRIYHIERDLELETLLLEKAHQFWNDYVLSNIAPPTQTIADCQALFKKEVIGKKIEADQSIVQSLNRLHELNSEIESFENKAAQIKQSIMDYMQEAEILTLENKTLATWKLPKTSYRLDSKRLTADHPELSAQYQTAVSNSRRLVIKDSKLSL
jgi:putative phage-type endonuclease